MGKVSLNEQEQKVYDRLLTAVMSETSATLSKDEAHIAFSMLAQFKALLEKK